MPRTVYLLVNRDKPEAERIASEVRSLVGRFGSLVGEGDASLDLGSRACEEAEPGAVGHADVVVVVGGDGTLLAQARRLARCGAALLGVNAGKLGFLAEFDPSSLEEQAAGLFGDGALAIREAPLIEATVRGSVGSVRRVGHAVNECAITAGPPYRMIHLGIRIDGSPGPGVRGDGLIVSTPRGSTAYNASAGGPIVHPGVDALTITPIAAHSLGFRPIVVPIGSRIEFELEQANSDGNGGGTTLVLDGQHHTVLSAGDTLELVASQVRARFVANPRGDYWRTLVEKLHWARPPKLRDR